MGASLRWGYIRIIAGTILGGAFGFYVMHEVEIGYKEMMRERMRRYQEELKRKEQQQQQQDNIISDS